MPLKYKFMGLRGRQARLVIARPRLALATNLTGALDKVTKTFLLRKVLHLALAFLSLDGRRTSDSLD
jgi:hypothetical protein